MTTWDFLIMAIPAVVALSGGVLAAVWTPKHAACTSTLNDEPNCPPPFACIDCGMRCTQGERLFLQRQFVVNRMSPCRTACNFIGFVNLYLTVQHSDQAHITF